MRGAGLGRGDSRCEEGSCTARPPGYNSARAGGMSGEGTVATSDLGTARH